MQNLVDLVMPKLLYMNLTSIYIHCLHCYSTWLPQMQRNAKKLQCIISGIIVASISMLVEKRHGNTQRIILILLTLVKLQIEVYIAMKESSTLPACMINDHSNRVKQKFDGSFASVRSRGCRHHRNFFHCFRDILTVQKL